MRRLAGRVAIVTGARQGIGAAVAELFVAEGATVVACDLDDDGSSGEQLLRRVLDVGDWPAWERLAAEIDSRFGRLDVLVNNAGIVGSYDDAATIELAVWDRVLTVNLTGSFYGARASVPLMRRSGGGTIVNVSSIWGIVGAPGVAAYQASKGGVRTLTKNLARTYAADGIRANSVHPGIVDTPLVRAQDERLTAELVAATPLGRIAAPREIAATILFLACDESSYVTGAELVVDGGYTIR
jgi:NAD(P)-dependent dehydrogenase (short-subunit alcohol dehydrogenase family)